MNKLTYRKASNSWPVLSSWLSTRSPVERKEERWSGEILNNSRNSFFKETFLTSTNLGDHSLCQGSALCQLLPEALTHVVVNIIGPQEFLKSLKVVDV